MKKILFVGGIHGVGKTSFCTTISESSKIPHYSASSLISKGKNELLSHDKGVGDVQSNQFYLINALKSLSYQPMIILDGHFCVLDKKGKIKRIPEATFLEISPVGFLVLKDSIEKISLRLKERDGQEYDLELLEDFQNQEIEYAQLLSKNLNIPLLIRQNHDNESRVNQFISNSFN